MLRIYSWTCVPPIIFKLPAAPLQVFPWLAEQNLRSPHGSIKPLKKIAPFPFKGQSFRGASLSSPKMPTLQSTLRFLTEQSTQMTVGSGGLSLGNLESELCKLWAVLLSRSAIVSWDSRISSETQHFWWKACNHIYSLRSHSNVESDMPRTLFPQAKRRT